jgi:hypothetical protein
MFGGASIFHHPISNQLDSDFKSFSRIDFRRFIVYFVKTNSINCYDLDRIFRLLRLLSDCKIGGTINPDKLGSNIAMLEDDRHFGQVSMASRFITPDIISPSKLVLSMFRNWFDKNKKSISERCYTFNTSHINDSML